MVKKDFLSRFQIFLNNQIPEEIISILKKTGYNTPLSFESLDLAQIRNIEEYINTRKDIIESLKYSEYVNVEPFSFLPGHRAFLLGLKEKVTQFHEFERNEAGKSKNRVIKVQNLKQNKHTNLANVGIENFGTGEEEDVENLAAISEALSVELSVENLKSQLKAKILNFSSKKNIKLVENNNTDEIDIDFGELEEIKNIHGQARKKCMLKCLLCEIRFACYYSSYWQISNYEHHLKKKHQEVNFEQQLDDLVEKQEKTKEPEENQAEQETTEGIQKNNLRENNTDKNLSIDATIHKKINDVLNFNTLHLK